MSKIIPLKCSITKVFTCPLHDMCRYFFTTIFVIFLTVRIFTKWRWPKIFNKKGRSMCRPICKENIGIDLKEIGVNVRSWIDYSAPQKQWIKLQNIWPSRSLTRAFAWETGKQLTFGFYVLSKKFWDQKLSIRNGLN